MAGSEGEWYRLVLWSTAVVAVGRMRADVWTAGRRRAARWRRPFVPQPPLATTAHLARSDDRQLGRSHLEGP